MLTQEEKQIGMIEAKLNEIVVADTRKLLEKGRPANKTGVRAHKEKLRELEDEYHRLGKKFEAGTLLDFEKDRMCRLSEKIKRRRQELRGFEV